MPRHARFVTEARPNGQRNAEMEAENDNFRCDPSHSVRSSSIRVDGPIWRRWARPRSGV